MKPKFWNSNPSSKGVLGLYEKAMSLVLKISAAYEADETRMRGTEPSWRERRGPCLVARLWKYLYATLPRRWRCPMSGRDGGLGGRWRIGFVGFLKKYRSRKLEMSDRKKKFK